MIDRTTDAAVAFAVMQTKFAGVGLATVNQTLSFAQDHLQDSDDKAAIGRAMVAVEKAQNVLSERFDVT